MVNKQDFEYYKVELQIKIGNKITEAINNLNEAITVKLENNKKIAFHCRELRQKRLIDSTWVYGGNVFIKIQDNGNKEEIKHLSQLTRKCPDHIFNFDD